MVECRISTQVATTHAAMIATGSVSSAQLPLACWNSNKHCAMRPPFGQIVDRHAMREEHQQAEEDVERRDGDDDRDDAEIVDQGGIDGAERYAGDRCQGEPDQPAAAADFRQRQRHHILYNRRRHGERDVDPARDQHHEQPHRENQVGRAGVEQVEEIGDGEEVVAGQRQTGADHEQHDDQPRLGRVGAEQPGDAKLRIDRGLQRVERDGARIIFGDDPARCHVQDAVGIEIDFRHFVGDQQDRQAFGRKLVRRSRKCPPAPRHRRRRSANRG